jgi:hypothetical protein
MLYALHMHITDSFTRRALRPPPLMSFAAAGGSLLSAGATTTLEAARAAAQAAMDDAAEALDDLRRAREAIESWPTTKDAGDLDAVLDHLDEVAAAVNVQADQVESLLASVRGRIEPESSVLDVLDTLRAGFAQSIDAYLAALSEVHWAVRALRAETQPAEPATPTVETAEELQTLLDSMKRGSV